MVCSSFNPRGVTGRRAVQLIACSLPASAPHSLASEVAGSTLVGPMRRRKRGICWEGAPFQLRAANLISDGPWLQVRLVCVEMGAAFAERGTVTPPWRSVNSLLSKWLPTKVRGYVLPVQR